MDTDEIVSALRTLTRAAQAVWDAESDESLNPHDKSRVDCPCRGCRTSAVWPPLIDAIEDADIALSHLEPSGRAGKADLAQQVYALLDAAYDGVLPNGDPCLHGQQISDLLDILAAHGAGAQL